MFKDRTRKQMRMLRDSATTEHELVAASSLKCDQSLEVKIACAEEVEDRIGCRHLIWVSPDPVEEIMPRRHSALGVILPPRLQRFETQEISHERRPPADRQGVRGKKWARDSVPNIGALDPRPV